MTDLKTERATASMTHVDTANGDRVGTMHYYKSDQSWRWYSMQILDANTLAAVVDLMREMNDA